LILTNVYRNGSIGKQCKIIKEGLNQSNFYSAVLYGRNTLEKESLVYKCCSEIESFVSKFMCRIFKRQYSFNFISTLEVIDFIKKSNVQVVNLHAINDNYINYKILLSYLKRNNVKVVYTAHSGNLIFGGCGGNNFECPIWKKTSGCLKCDRKNSKRYRRNWEFNAKLFSNFKNFSIVCVSKYLEEEFKKCPYFKDKRITTILDCVGDDFKPNYCFDNNKLKNMQSIHNRVLYVTPSFSNPNKGFNFLLEIATRMIDYNFVCVSYDNKPNLTINNISFIGPIYCDETMATIYTFCDVTLVLSRSETFCLPVAESLSCGTPVVGFKCGGAENIALSKYSKFSEFGDIDEIIKNIAVVSKMKNNSSKIAAEAKKVYSKKNMIDGYITVFSENTKKYYFEVEV